jgi:hypothetical protein
MPTRNLHVTETFTLHKVVAVEGRTRPMIEQTTYMRGELISDAADIEKIEQARDDGTIGHNVFVAVMTADEAPAEKAEEPAKAAEAPKPEEPPHPVEAE